MQIIVEGARRAWCAHVPPGKGLSMSEIMGAQVRMARAFLRWSIAELARRAGVGESTVKAIEATDDYPAIGGGLEATLEHRAAQRADSVSAVEKALATAGITFLADNGQGPGVRAKRRKR